MKHSLALVSLLVRNYDEAISFFTEKLDFELVEDTILPAESKRWVVVKPNGSNGCNILLAKASTPEQNACVGRQAGGRVFLFLQSQSFQTDYERFSSRGVRFVREPKTEPYGQVAVFEDLYGNRWDLIEYSNG